MEMTIAAIKSHVYVLWGDPGPMYRRSEGLLLDFNGAICCDSDSKQDRYIGKEMCVRLLQQGGSLLIYPEGAWNIIENQVVIPLFSGTAEMAICTGAEVVPVAMEQYGKKYYVKIGKNVDFSGYDIVQKEEATDQLRDILSTLKWEIWEQYDRAIRKEIPAGYSEIFLAHYRAYADDAYTLEDVQKTRYHSKAATPREAFAFMGRLIPSKANAFLLKESSWRIA